MHRARVVAQWAGHIQETSSAFRMLGRMLDMLGNAQVLILLTLGVAALALEVYALVDALRYPAKAYTAAGKLNKQAWVAILVVATMVGFVTVTRVLGLGILGVVAAGVYLADVRPALRAVTPRGGWRGSRGSSGSGGQGPYGRW